MDAGKTSPKKTHNHNQNHNHSNQDDPKALSPRSLRGKVLFKEKEKERENEHVHVQSDVVGVGTGGIRAGASVVSPRDAGEQYDKLGRKKKKKDPSKAKQIRPLKIEIVCGACEFIEAKGIF